MEALLLVSRTLTPLRHGRACQPGAQRCCVGAGSTQQMLQQPKRLQSVACPGCLASCWRSSSGFGLCRQRPGCQHQLNTWAGSTQAGSGDLVLQACSELMSEPGGAALVALRGHLVQPSVAALATLRVWVSLAASEPPSVVARLRTCPTLMLNCPPTTPLPPGS